MKQEEGMSTQSQRIEIFQDTMSWVQSNPDLSASINLAKKNTQVIWENDYPQFDQSKTYNTVITVSGDRSYQAAMRIKKETPESKIAVMNFANAFHPGGGVTKGSNTQEEGLCRTSTLCPLLYRKRLDLFLRYRSD